MAKVTKEYGEDVALNAKTLTDSAKLEPSTGHATLEAAGLVLPKNITLQSLNDNIKALNDLSISVEMAGNTLAQNAHKDNEKINTISASLALGDNLVINTQTFLKQDLGESGTVYGQSVTSVDHQYDAEQAAYLDQVRSSNQAEAQKLFG